MVAWWCSEWVALPSHHFRVSSPILSSGYCTEFCTFLLSRFSQGSSTQKHASTVYSTDWWLEIAPTFANVCARWPFDRLASHSFAFQSFGRRFCLNCLESELSRWRSRALLKGPNSRSLEYLDSNSQPSDPRIGSGSTTTLTVNEWMNGGKVHVEGMFKGKLRIRRESLYHMLSLF